MTSDSSTYTSIVEEPIDWQDIALEMAQQLEMALTRLKNTGDWTGVLYNRETGLRQTWEESFAKSIERVPGWTVDRRYIEAKYLPAKQRREAWRKLDVERAKAAIAAIMGEAALYGVLSREEDTQKTCSSPAILECRKDCSLPEGHTGDCQSEIWVIECKKAFQENYPDYADLDNPIADTPQDARNAWFVWKQAWQVAAPKPMSVSLEKCAMKLYCDTNRTGMLWPRIIPWGEFENKKPFYDDAKAVLDALIHQGVRIEYE